MMFTNFDFSDVSDGGVGEKWSFPEALGIENGRFGCDVETGLLEAGDGF